MRFAARSGENPSIVTGPTPGVMAPLLALMLAYACSHNSGTSMSRKRPLIRFPSLEMSGSANNLFVALSGSISLPLLSETL